MLKKWLLSLVVTLSMYGDIHSTSSVRAEPVEQVKAAAENEAVKLKDEMQKLWTEYAWWLRSYMVSHLAGLDDEQDVLERLLQNQTEIGNSIKPYYGSEAGDKLTELLHEHITIAGKLIKATKEKDQKHVEKYNKEWFRNADAIILLLTDKNPHWKKEEMTDMFYAHLRFTTDAVSARMNDDWKGDIRLAGLNEEHLIRLSGMLADGMVKQFQEHFDN